RFWKSCLAAGDSGENESSFVVWDLLQLAHVHSAFWRLLPAFIDPRLVFLGVPKLRGVKVVAANRPSESGVVGNDYGDVLPRADAEHGPARLAQVQGHAGLGHHVAVFVHQRLADLDGALPLF